jgi:hypothetical protein
VLGAERALINGINALIEDTREMYFLVYPSEDAMEDALSGFLHMRMGQLCANQEEGLN